ncbi:helix-turn-helix transcriptional regulator [Rhizobium leguminosarum]|uniref:helix-turn-helix transcriptional regulator n=1 Tax=Rhizobium leguminosarum TaxID=384 RepID=UPI001AE3CC31
MDPIPSIVLKIAREFLGLSQDQIAILLGIARSTVQRIERGDDVAEPYVSVVRRFYEDQGIQFLTPADGEGWGLRNTNLVSGRTALNTLANIPRSKRAKPLPTDQS